MVDHTAKHVICDMRTTSAKTFNELVENRLFVIPKKMNLQFVVENLIPSQSMRCSILVLREKRKQRINTFTHSLASLRRLSSERQYHIPPGYSCT